MAKRDVHGSCIDFLHIEMVEWAMRSSGFEETEEDTNLPATAQSKLEKIGFQVGVRLAERYTKDKPRLTENLDTIKFICKDFWMELFKKNIDQLRTNHRGTFVLHDSKFRWLSRLSSANTQNAEKRAVKYLIFPCGLIKGALTNLGLSCDVTAEIQGGLPACNFIVTIKGVGNQ